MLNVRTIAVDFDGTIVENKYPEIGKPIMFAIESLKKLQEEGNLLILWTYRSGTELENAVEFCKKNGINFYAVNKSYPEEVFDESQSRKIQADIFIDDRNMGGLVGWGEIYQTLGKESIYPSNKISNKKKKPGKGILSFLKPKI